MPGAYLSTDPNAGTYLSTDPNAGRSTAPPASATKGMLEPSSLAPKPPQSLTDRFLHGPQITDPQSGEPVQMLGGPGILADASTVGSLGSAVTAAKGIPGILARAAGVSKARAGTNIAEAVAAAKDVPLHTPGIQASVDEMMQFSQPGEVIENVPRVVKALAKRLSKGPLTVEKARLYAPAISRGSANEWGNLTPNMQRLLGGLRGPMNEAITAAAETVGKGEQYASGMKEYARASKAAKVAKETLSPAVRDTLKWLLRGTAAAGGMEAYNRYFD